MPTALEAKLTTQIFVRRVLRKMEQIVWSLCGVSFPKLLPCTIFLHLSYPTAVLKRVQALSLSNRTLLIDLWSGHLPSREHLLLHSLALPRSQCDSCVFETWLRKHCLIARIANEE